MAHTPIGTIHDQPAITTAGNLEERDAQVERVQERYERLHRLDTAVDDVAGLADACPDWRPHSDDKGH